MPVRTTSGRSGFRESALTLAGEVFARRSPYAPLAVRRSNRDPAFGARRTSGTRTTRNRAPDGARRGNGTRHNQMVGSASGGSRPTEASDVRGERPNRRVASREPFPSHAIRQPPLSRRSRNQPSARTASSASAPSGAGRAIRVPMVRRTAAWSRDDNRLNPPSLLATSPGGGQDAAPFDPSSPRTDAPVIHSPRSPGRAR